MLVYLFAGHALEPLVVDLEDKVPGKEAPVPVRHSPRQDGLHHHPRLLSADDAKAKPGAVIDQVDDLQQEQEVRTASSRTKRILKDKFSGSVVVDLDPRIRIIMPDPQHNWIQHFSTKPIRT